MSPESAAGGPAGGRLRAAICSVGSEVVAGEQVDTNGAWLARRLDDLGVSVVRRVAVRDDVGEIVGALRWLAPDSDVVILGGGLGPTSDDRTREAVAAAGGAALEQRDPLVEAIRARFDEYGVDMPDSNLRQARLPAGAEAYEPVGTAPGFHLELPGGDGPVQLHVLPGVPWELREMFERDVEPRLAARTGGVRVVRVVHVAGMSEARLAEEVDAAVAAAGVPVEVSYLATGTEIRVRLAAAAGDRPSAEDAADGALAAVRDALGPAVSGVDGQTLEAGLVATLTAAGERVAVAESATAGQVCSRLADVPGASAVLAGGAVVYATAAKEAVLGVSADLLAEHGPVSRETTRALARRVRAVCDADWGLATTGVAGPDPQDGVEVGTVWWALAAPDGDVEVYGRRLPGDRATIRSRLASAVLEALRRRLADR